MKASVTERVVTASQKITPLPGSFNGNGWLYALAFIAVLSIAIFGGLIVRWMARDLWRDRRVDHPKSLLFAFRFMILLAGLAATVRSAPEVAYMTVVGDRSFDPGTVAAILTIKRAFDVIGLPAVVGWMGLFCLIYPYVVLALRSRDARRVELDLVAQWPRMVKPAIMLLLVIAIGAARQSLRRTASGERLGRSRRGGGVDRDRSACRDAGSRRARADRHVRGAPRAVPFIKSGNLVVEGSTTLLVMLGAFVTIVDHQLSAGLAFWVGVGFGGLGQGVVQIWQDGHAVPSSAAG